MKVYEFIYTDSPEGYIETISIHRTRKGAEVALSHHKENKLKEWAEIYITPEDKEEMPFGMHCYWGVRETELQD